MHEFSDKQNIWSFVLRREGIYSAAWNLLSRQGVLEISEIHLPLSFLLIYFFIFGFSRQGFSMLLLESVLELAPVDKAGLEPTEIYLFLPPKCWD